MEYLYLSLIYFIFNSLTAGLVSYNGLIARRIGQRVTYYEIVLYAALAGWLWPAFWIYVVVRTLRRRR